MRCLFLYNPASGKGKIKKRLPYIEKKLKQKYGEVVSYATKSGQDLEEHARTGAEEFDAIVFSGGDGTFHHVLQGTLGKEIQLGYLPSGTANDVAHTLGIPRSIKGALGVILKGEPKKIDFMRVNDTHCAVYVVAAGAFTAVTYETPQKKKRALGWFAYASEIVKNLNFETFPIRIKCGETCVDTQGVLILVMNGRRIAGFPVNGNSSISDGKMEIAVVKQMRKRRRRFSELVSIAHLFFFGYRVKKKDIEFLSGDEVEIDAPDCVLWDFDGEKGIRGKVKIELVPAAVNLFTPRKKRV